MASAPAHTVDQPRQAMYQDLREIVRQEVHAQMMVALSGLNKGDRDDLAAAFHEKSNIGHNSLPPMEADGLTLIAPVSAREVGHIHVQPEDADSSTGTTQEIDEETLDSMFSYMMWKATHSEESSWSRICEVVSLVGLLLIESVLVFAFADCFMSRFVISSWTPRGGVVSNNCFYQGLQLDNPGYDALRFSKVIWGLPSAVWAAAFSSFLIIGFSMRSDDREMLLRRHLRIPKEFNLCLRLFLSAIRAIRAVYIPSVLVLGVGFMVVESPDVGDLVVNSVAAVFLLDLDSELFRSIVNPKQKEEYHKSAVSAMRIHLDTQTLSSSSEYSSDDDSSENEIPGLTTASRKSRLCACVSTICSSAWLLYAANVSFLIAMFIYYSMGRQNWDHNDVFQKLFHNSVQNFLGPLTMLRCIVFTFTGVQAGDLWHGMLGQSWCAIICVFLLELVAAVAMNGVYDYYVMAILFGEDTAFDYPAVTACLNGTSVEACFC